MPLDDPIKVYFAANNIEANLLCEMLKNAGIEASPIEDHSQAGTWMGGLVPNLHRPQVWVNRCDEERARSLIADFEALASERRHAHERSGSIRMTCEHCGAAISFSAALAGSVQACPECEEYVDVGDDGGLEGWEMNSDSPQTDS
jgi:hypothetical protein